MGDDVKMQSKASVGNKYPIFNDLTLQDWKVVPFIERSVTRAAIVLLPSSLYQPWTEQDTARPDLSQLGLV